MKSDTLDQAGEGGALRAPLNWWQSTRGFLTEVRQEMKRVTWPAQREVYATTIVVILTSVFFGIYLFSVDILLNNAAAWIFKRFGAQ